MNYFWWYIHTIHHHCPLQNGSEEAPKMQSSPCIVAIQWIYSRLLLLGNSFVISSKHFITKIKSNLTSVCSLPMLLLSTGHNVFTHFLYSITELFSAITITRLFYSVWHLAMCTFCHFIKKSSQENRISGIEVPTPYFPNPTKLL